MRRRVREFLVRSQEVGDACVVVVKNVKRGRDKVRLKKTGGNETKGKYLRTESWATTQMQDLLF